MRVTHPAKAWELMKGPCSFQSEHLNIVSKSMGFGPGNLVQIPPPPLISVKLGYITWPLWASTERSSAHPRRVLCSGERKAALHTRGYPLRAITCFQILSIVSEGKYGKHRKVQRIWSQLKPHHSELQMATEEGRSLAKGWPQASLLHWRCHLRPVIWLLGTLVLSSLKGGHCMDES